jgi:hypothetical protein
MRRLLDGVREFGGLVGKPVAVFSVFDHIFEALGVTPANPYQDLVAVQDLLDGYPFQFEQLRKTALASIARRLDALQPGVAGALVRMPATVNWRHINVQFKDHHAIAETIAPDRVVTVINAEWKIQQWFETPYGKRALELVAQTDEITIAEILQWFANEVSTAEDWADWCSHLTGKNVRQYVLGAEAPSREDRGKFIRDVDNLLKAATTPGEHLPSFYASYSMTQSGQKERAIINDAVWQMRARGLVIDPGTIEIGGQTPDKDRAAVYSYTVLRDLAWDVRKVDIVAAIHPYSDTPPPLSTGMTEELSTARAYNKDRYLVLPQGGESPFTGGNYIPKNHQLKMVSELFQFLDKRGVKARWADQVDAFAKWAANQLDEHDDASHATQQSPADDDQSHR